MEDKKSDSSAPRQVGFEIEYAGIPLEDVANVITDMFGGVIHKKHRAYYLINDTDIGDFTAELDAIPLQNIAEQTLTLAESDKTIDAFKHRAGTVAGDIGEKIAPSEIVCPPIPVHTIDRIDALCKKLHDIGAKGTKQSFYYAFGLHINPEAVSLEALSVTRHIQSFSLLYPWLKHVHHVDMSRRITPYINPFPASYLSLILRADYAPDIATLIKDYHAHNPDRNRALDMLPLFAFLDESYVRELYGEEEKINTRPTYHYRLPNCDIDQPDWSVSQEWTRWQAVEALADNTDRLASLLADYQRHQEQWLRTESGWLHHMKQHMQNLSKDTVHD